MFEKAREVNQSLYLRGVYFTKAFSMVEHDHLYLAILDMRFPFHLIKQVCKLYSQQKARVKTASLLPDSYPTYQQRSQVVKLGP